MIRACIARRKWFSIVIVWFARVICPDHYVVVFARDDDATFGILHSRFHGLVFLGTWLGVGNDRRYTPTTTFETFPSPRASRQTFRRRTTPTTLVRKDRRRGEEARRLAPRLAQSARPRRHRSRSDADRGPGEAPRRYPDRILPKNVEAAAKPGADADNIYNQRPRWLADAHEALDRAVAAAYGWDEEISTDEALARLLALNLERARKERPDSQ